MSRSAFRIGLALLPFAVGACGSVPPAQVGSEADRLDADAFSGPIILITLSGLRPDAVGALGGEGPWTPSMDAFAEDADWVGTAVVGSSTPVVSLVSLMTGVTPWQHQVLSSKPASPRPGIPLLSQALARSGYRTVARVPLDYRLNRFDLLAGFDEVAEIEPIDAVGDRLQELDGEAEFFWLHLREASTSFVRRDAELPRLADRSIDLPRRIDARQLLRYADPEVPLPPEERSIAWELFCHEVAWADRQVGQLLSALRASEAWPESWVILTATQGTELGEHGQVLYSQNLGRESIEVPLMIKLPRSLRGSVASRSLETLSHRVNQLRLWSTLVEAVGARVTPVHQPGLFRTTAPVSVSELYQRNGVNEFSLLADDVQLLWTTRFAPAEPEFYSAQLAQSGGRPPLSEPARRILGRLERAFRRSPPLSGPIGGEAPTLRLERWVDQGTVRMEDGELAERLAKELRREWRRFVDYERSPAEESSLSGFSR